MIVSSAGRRIEGRNRVLVSPHLIARQGACRFDESKKIVDGIIARYEEKNYGQEAVARAKEIKAILDAPKPN
jgi:hypothetical protein